MAAKYLNSYLVWSERTDPATVFAPESWDPEARIFFDGRRKSIPESSWIYRISKNLLRFVVTKTRIVGDRDLMQISVNIWGWRYSILVT